MGPHRVREGMSAGAPAVVRCGWADKGAGPGRRGRSRGAQAAFMRSLIPSATPRGLS